MGDGVVNMHYIQLSALYQISLPPYFFIVVLNNIQYLY